MTQKEAIIKVLTDLGGRAHLKSIYPRVAQLVAFKEGSDSQATIRNHLQTHPEHFRQTEGMKGYWELVSFQEEIASLKQEINDLKNQLLEKDRTIEDLKTVKTEDDFVKRLLKETKKMFNHERSKAVGISQLLDKMGRCNDFEDLDAWIEGRERRAITQNNIYPQAGSTANIGCEIKNPEFKMLHGTIEGQPSLKNNKEGIANV